MTITARFARKTLPRTASRRSVKSVPESEFADGGFGFKGSGVAVGSTRFKYLK
jgi:hypothetical protein